MISDHEPKFLRKPRTAPLSDSFVMLAMLQADQQQPRSVLRAQESPCFFANPCLDCGWIFHQHSFHKPNMLSARDHRFPF